MSETVQETQAVETASFVAEVGDIVDMINRSALSGEDEHDNLYLDISEDEVKILQSAPGDSVLTYGSFYESYFDDLSVDGDDSVAAIIKVEQTLDFLDMVAPSGKVELTFSGDDTKPTCRTLEVTGDLEARVTLPGGRDAVEKVPDWLPERFSDEDVYMSSPDAGSKELPTKIDTNVGSVERIIEARKNIGSPAYPIVVEDGDFMMDIGDDNDYVRGSLDGNDVEGPDVDNTYLSGFEEIFNVLSGRIQLQTAPDNGPLAVVKGGAKSVVRHVNASITVD